MTTWFISDTHFGHTNVIEYSRRPFRDVTEMDESMLLNWNATVAPGDRVFHIGDFLFGEPERHAALLTTLRGRITLVRGNHDGRLLTAIKRGKVHNPFAEIVDYKEITIDRELFVLCHYPMARWNAGHHGSYMLHGHCHGSMNHENQQRRRLDVGVDNHGFTPINIDTVRATLRDRGSTKHH